MNSILSVQFLTHRLILASFGVVAVIAAGSAFYYVEGTKVPSVNVTPTQTSAEHVTASGTVEPSQNPDLGFLAAGRLTRLPVSVGQKVIQGQLLASLDTASLSAQRAQAAANLAATQAKLDSMQVGPRSVDVQAKQTAVSQAQTTLSNIYANIPDTVASAYDRSFSGVSGSTDTLFNQPNTGNPSLVFGTTNASYGNNAAADRTQINADLVAWNTEVNSLSTSATNEQLDSELDSALVHLALVRTYCNDLLGALANATPSNSFSSASVTAAETSVTAVRDSINTLVATIKSTQQQIASSKLAVQAAQDSLAQTQASATQQDIEAQQAAIAAAAANVQNIDAQIGNAILRAPFSGSVASVHAKIGDIIVPNTPVISLDPSSAQQITAYVSESDAGKILAGESADVTLDAYGSDRHFAATVVTIDNAPTMQSNVPAYKVVLQFTQNDPAIASGMSANITFSK